MKIAVVDDMRDEVNTLNTYLSEYSKDNDLDIRLECFPSAEDFLHSNIKYKMIVMLFKPL